MKRTLTLAFVCILLPFCSFSQSRKKPVGSSIHAATTFNYYQSLKPFEFIGSRTAYSNDLILTYLTSNSGTFVIEEGDYLILERTLESKLPSQVVSLGASVQFRRMNGVFQEISLTKLSFIKSSNQILYAHTDTAGTYVARFLGYDEKMMTLGLRYEVGKYFGHSKDRFRFGISGGVEPSFYRYKRTSFSTQEYPMEGSLFTIDVSVIPMLSVMLSKKVSLDFKLIPNVLMADFGKIKERDPTKTVSQQAGIRNYQSPDLTWAFSMQLRYMIREPKDKK